MTIQFDPTKNMVRVGDKFFPATPFPEMDQNFPYCQGYKIPLGESGEELSIAVGMGTYSDNYNVDEDNFSFVDDEFVMVEIGFTDDDGNFDVIGYQQTDDLARMIIKQMGK